MSYIICQLKLFFSFLLIKLTQTSSVHNILKLRLKVKLVEGIISENAFPCIDAPQSPRLKIHFKFNYKLVQHIKCKLNFKH